MRPEDWSVIEPHLDALLDLDPAERSAYLDQHFGPGGTDDRDRTGGPESAKRRAALEDLVADCEAADGYLTGGLSAAMVESARRTDLDALALVGRRLGPFRLTEILGSGGMGTVFRGERIDGQFEQRVAVKVANRGHLDEAGRARFDFERRILAGLEHPGIARLYDGGVTDDHLPYLVMEEVDGVPIDRAALDLPRAARLQLLARAALAVDHAHQRRVVHRDLKPSNLLVTPAGEVKLLDFGVAELSEGGAEPTPSSALTVLYAAPEQLDGEAATNSADLWSLGVLLYVLLTGSLPYPRLDGESLAARSERLRRDPPAPTGAGGEADAVVHRALAGSPDARYPSAREFADDLERLADRRAVSALAPTPLYVLRTHARRHPTQWLLGLLAAVALVGLLVISAQSSRRAEARAAVARELARDAERIEGFLRHAYALPLHDVRAEAAATRERMASIRERATGAARPSALLALGRGHVQLREPEAAVEALREALDAGERAAARPLGRALAEIWLTQRAAAARMRDPLLRQSRLEALDRKFRQPALELLDESKGAGDSTLEDPWSPPALGMGYAALLDDDFDAAERAARDLQTVAPWLAEGPRLLAETLRARGTLAATETEIETAGTRFLEADSALERAIALAPSDPALRQARCDLALQRVGLALQRRASQETVFEEGSARCRESRRSDPSRAAAHAGIAQLHLARVQDPNIDRDARAGHLESAREAVDHALSREPLDPQSLEFAGSLHLTQALLFELPTGADPVPSLERAADFFERAVAEEPGMLGAQVNLGTARAVAAEQVLARGGDAEPVFEQAVEAYRSSLETNPRHPLLLANLATLEFRRSERLPLTPTERLQRLDAALATAQRALEVDEDLIWGWNLIAVAQYHRGLASFARGDDGSPEWQLAAAALEEVERIDASYALGKINRASLALDRLRRRGEAPLTDAETTALDAALASVEGVLETAPSPSARQTLHELHRFRALRAAATEAPRARVLQHLEAARDALALPGDGTGSPWLRLSAARLEWVDGDPSTVCSPRAEAPLLDLVADAEVAEAARRAVAEREIWCAARLDSADSSAARNRVADALDALEGAPDLRRESEALRALFLQLESRADSGAAALRPDLLQALERDPFLALEPAGRAVLDGSRSDRADLDRSISDS